MQEDRSASDLGNSHSGSGETNPPRASADVIVFNAVAKKIIDESGSPIDDLYALVKPRLEELQLPANVHFNKDATTCSPTTRREASRWDRARAVTMKRYRGHFFIGVYPRSSAANWFEILGSGRTKPNWPPMNADKRR